MTAQPSKSNGGPPPGIDIIDRMVEFESHKQRLAAIKQQIENDWIESHFDKGPHVESEYEPFSRENMKR